jgi:3-keto-5-aminohexanoate cleavage enzyme
MNEYMWDYRDPYEWMRRTRKSQLGPLIVTCAVTGGVHGKEANPALPETPEEQAVQTYDAYRAGASMVHVHARDPLAWYDCARSAEQYVEVNRAIRDRCPDIIINNSTGGGPGMSREERARVLDANPEVATLNMGPDVHTMTLKARTAPIPSPREATYIGGCNPIDYEEVTLFAEAMQERGIKPEMELYHPGMYWVFDHLREQRLLKEPYMMQFVMGVQTGTYPTPQNLLAFVNELPAGSIFTTAAMGVFQLPLTVLSILLGGHVRVGMEDNVYAKRGQLYTSNAEAVERIVRIAHDMNREVATPQQAREMLGLSQRPSQYS